MSDGLSRRGFLKRVAVAIGGALLAGCRPAAPQPTPQPVATPVPEVEATPPPAVPVTEKVAVTFTMYGHPGMVEEMVPLFNETHPDVEVKFERSEGHGYWEKLAAAVAAATAWDCFRGNQMTALRWGPAGAVIDFKPFLDVDTVYPADDYLPGIIDTYAVAGKVYGGPVWCLTMWLFYNKNLFDESGLAYPTPDTTWEEYVELARKLTETDSSGRITQFGSNGWEWWTFPVAQAVWSNGGCFYYNDDMTNTCVDDPKTVQALQGIADLIHVHKVAPSPLSPPAVPVGLLSDNVGMEANGDYLPWDQRDVFDAKYDYLDATLCPTWGGKRVNIYWPDCFLINARSSPEVQAAAYKWVSWFACDPESIAIQCKVVFPVVKRAYDDAEIAQRWLVRPRPPGMIKAAMQHTQTARYWMADLRINDLDEIYYGEISRLWNGDATAEEVCRVIQEEMSKIMAKPVDL